MRRSYKYRIYPTRLQGEALEQIFYLSRFLFNSALEERRSYYRKTGKSLSYSQQCSEITEIAEYFPEYENVYSQTRQQTLKTVETAYKNFFRRVKQKASKAGFPRFKSKDRFRSICFPQIKQDLSGGGAKLLPNEKLRIFGLPGEMKVKWHRPFQGRCKTLQIVRQAGQQWYIVISCDDVSSSPLQKTGKTAGFDFGLSAFLTEDDGTKFHHPKPWRTAKEKLAENNRKLALKQRDSKNRQRAKTALQKAHQKVCNVREDFQHKLANRLIRENDVLILEKLNIRGLLEKEDGQRNLRSGIQDAAWGMFIFLLLYKAESAGREVRQVDPQNTSKMCSCCGKIKENLKLQDRTYKCGFCDLEMDRDQNAAKNIKRIGLILADISNEISSEAPTVQARWG